MKRLKVIFVFLLATSSLALFGQEEIRTPLVTDEDFAELYLSNYQIDSRYKAGKILIYDCEKLSFTCVDADSIDNCNDRNQKMQAISPDRFSCVKLKEYKTRKDCLIANLKFVEEPKLAPLCLRPKRESDF